MSITLTRLVLCLTLHQLGMRYSLSHFSPLEHNAYCVTPCSHVCEFALVNAHATRDAGPGLPFWAWQTRFGRTGVGTSRH